MNPQGYCTCRWWFEAPEWMSTEDARIWAASAHGTVTCPVHGSTSWTR